MCVSCMFYVDHELKVQNKLQGRFFFIENLYGLGRFFYIKNLLGSGYNKQTMF